jgi:excisionase family DNA binding protein
MFARESPSGSLLGNPGRALGLAQEDVAAHLGVAEDSVYRWIHEKGLSAHETGKLWKSKQSKVDA